MNAEIVMLVEYVTNSCRVVDVCSHLALTAVWYPFSFRLSSKKNVSV